MTSRVTRGGSRMDSAHPEPRRPSRHRSRRDKRARQRSLGLSAAKPAAPGGNNEEPTQYTMDIRTEDQRMSIAADGEDRLWMYALIACNKPK